MTYGITEEFKSRVPGRFIVMISGGELNHRAMVIHRAANFEYEFKLYLLKALRKINPTISDAELENKGIFSEPNMLSSLSKCLRLAKLLNLITQDEQHDIKKIIELRNMYAHDRDRNQLSQDPEAIAVLRSLKLYQYSKDVLSGVTDQHVFLCCIQFLQELIIAKTAAL